MRARALPLRAGAVLLLLALSAAAEDLALAAIRDNVKQRPDDRPPATVLTIDLLGPSRLLESRKVRIRDPEMRRCLFRDPFIFPARPDLAYLVCRDKAGLRCLRLSWARGEDLGKSFRVECGDLQTRPIHVVSERIGFLTPTALLSVDLRLGHLIPTHSPLRPLDFDPVQNRLYVADGARVAYFPLVAIEPPKKLAGAPTPLLELPDDVRAVRGAVSRDALKVAYASPNPSQRADAQRFLLSIADNRDRLLARRTVAGRLHDVKWLDNDRVIVTTTDREATSIHVFSLTTSTFSSRVLPARYLAPPELVPAAALGLRRRS